MSWAGWNGFGTFGYYSIISPKGEVLMSDSLEFLMPSICANSDILFPFMDEKRNMFFSKINQNAGDRKIINIPQGFENLSIQAKSYSKNSYIFFTWNKIGLNRNGKLVNLEFPNGYRVRDINIYDGLGLIYLQSGKTNLKDALGIVNLTEKFPKILIKQLDYFELSEGGEGGKIKTLDKEHIYFCSTAGWMKILSINNDGVVTKKDITRFRNIDAMCESKQSGLLACARRSGDITIYNLNGAIIGRLLGEKGSDGGNILYERIMFDEKGEQLVSVSRYGVRIWKKPKYELIIPYNDTFNIADEIPSQILSYYNFAAENKKPVAKISDYLGNLKINEFGLYSLSIFYENQTDFLETGIAKYDERVLFMKSLNESCCNLGSDDATRLFILSPDIINNIIKDEFAENRIWKIDSSIYNTWIN